MICVRAPILFLALSVFTALCEPSLAHAADTTDSYKCRDLLASDATSSGQDRALQEFLADPAFHWFEAPDILRRPPPVFDSRIAPLVTPYIKQLPTGMTSEERRFYQGVFNLLRDNGRVFRLLKIVEGEIAQLSGGRPDKKEKAFEALLRTYEEAHGFQVTGLYARLSTEDFFRVLGHGWTVIDFSGGDIRLKLSRHLTAREGHWHHGVFSHRLQWHLVLRDLALHPNLYGSPKDVLALYKRMVSQELAAALNWENAGLPPPFTGDKFTLFFQLFDSQENNASSPGFFYEYRRYWSGIPHLK